uniref:IST1-like protein n=1 Tax=Leersia perrieri TaxID=77586 RepID=A0A0D9VS38_9ORYZ
MGLFGGKSTSKQTAKLKSLIKLAAARLAVARRPRLGRRSIARGDVAQLLSIGHLDRALLRAEQVVDEDNMLEVLDIIELYCKILIEQATQLDKPKECGEEIKEAVAGLVFASARCGDLPELIDARAIIADKFGREFAAAAKDGAHGDVDLTLVRKLSGARASTEQTRRLVKEIAAENDILLDFHDNTGGIDQGKQNEQVKNVRAEQFVKQNEIKRDHHEVQGRQRFVDEEVNPRLARLSVQEQQYTDTRMAAEAAFKSASFAAMAARAAVELSRSESQGKGSRGGGGYEKVHPVQKPTPSPLPPSPSWSDRSTVTSVGSEKGKGVVFDESGDEEVEEDDVVAWTPQLRRPQPPTRRTASAVGIGGGDHTRPFQDGVYSNLQHTRPPHRRHASELTGSGVASQYREPPYRREPAVYRDSNGGAAQERNGVRPGAYESSEYVRQPYSRIVSALERGNEHIARHEEVRRIGTDERVLQERVYGGGGGGGAPGRAPLDQETRINSVRTRR